MGCEFLVSQEPSPVPLNMLFWIMTCAFVGLNFVHFLPTSIRTLHEAINKYIKSLRDYAILPDRQIITQELNYATQLRPTSDRKLH